MATANYSDDELEFEDEDDYELNKLKEKRMAEYKFKMDKLQSMRDNGHGVYSEVYSEKEVLKITTSIDKVLVHFYHKEFKRCTVLDIHLEKIAKKYFNTKVIRIDVERAPFLVQKLEVKVLPCLIGFIKAISADKLVGFEEFGNNDNFKTRELEDRLFKYSFSFSEMIDAEKIKSSYKPIVGYPAEYENSDDD